ncbi:MAG TPA: Wzz/FepE/Etk N-terminal domain-containing protein, partial [bacterium]|nr:Wzz/FepE/Etk N-terminal domain-containing protein [bacterium]
MNGGLIQEESYSLLDAISVLFRHKWKIAFFFLFMVTASVAAALLLPKTYESYAKILIRLGRENMAVDPGVVGPALQLVQDRENQVNSELSILRSRSIAEKVVDKIGEQAFVPPASGMGLLAFGGSPAESKDVPATVDNTPAASGDSLAQRFLGGKPTLRD